jgi:hypothetical protein
MEPELPLVTHEHLDVRPGRGRADDRRRPARELAGRIGARWVVPMHYRTPRIGFLETADVP